MNIHIHSLGYILLYSFEFIHSFFWWFYEYIYQININFFILICTSIYSDVLQKHLKLPRSKATDSTRPRKLSLPTVYVSVCLPVCASVRPFVWLSVFLYTSVSLSSSVVMGGGVHLQFQLCQKLSFSTKGLNLSSHFKHSS